MRVSPRRVPVIPGAAVVRGRPGISTHKIQSLGALKRPTKSVSTEAPMCESHAYLVYPDGKRELVMESVGLLRPDGTGVFLRSIFGEEKTVDAVLAEMNLTGHSITLAPRD